MVKSLTIAELVEHCQAEAERYRQFRESDEIYCFELFYRALSERNEAAWQAIYNQYRPLVISWVRGCDLFSQTNEDVEFFVNGAFTLLWRFGSKPETAAKLISLGMCLKYLKACAGSAVRDYDNKSGRDVLKKANPLPGEDYPSPSGPTDESTLSGEELRQALWETLQDNKVEHLVAEESWIYGFTPKQIQKRHPDKFSTVAEVSQIKRNMLRRLQRRLRGEEEE